LKAHQAKARQGHQDNNQRNATFGHATKLSGYGGEEPFLTSFNG